MAGYDAIVIGAGQNGLACACYLCGSGTHPGAGVAMASGRNAAQLISADLGLGSLGIAPFPPRSRAAR